MRPKDSYPDRNTPPYWNADLTLYIHTSLTTSSFSHRTCSGVLLSLCSQTRNLAHSYANHSNTLLRASCQKMSKRSVFKKGGAGSKGRLTIKRKEHHEPATRSIIHTILMKQSAHMVPHTRARTRVHKNSPRAERSQIERSQSTRMKSKNAQEDIAETAWRRNPEVKEVISSESMHT